MMQRTTNLRHSDTRILPYCSSAVRNYCIPAVRNVRIRSANVHMPNVRTFNDLIHKVLVLLFCTGSLLSCGEIETPADRHEIRGVWITNIDSDVMFDRAKTAEAMQYLADRGFNIVFPVVWNGGYTLYPSDVMVQYFGEDYRIDPQFEGRDPLRDIIYEARKHGMEVMPWFEFGFASSHDEGGGHILEAYPNWAARDSDGQLLTKNKFEWMNAFHHEVQEFILGLITEVIENYDIDGIQGDDRLPALPAEGGYSEYTRNLYKLEFGEDPPMDPREDSFLQWKADRLSDFGERMYELVKYYDPELMVSLSPSIYDWSKNEYLQDWTKWVRRGTVDLLHPQVYRYDIEAYLAELRRQQDYFLDADGSRQPDTSRDHSIYHAPGVLIKVGQNYNGPAYVRQALDLHHELDLDGEVYFFYEGLHEENENLGDSIYAYHYHKPAFLPHREYERRKPAYLLAHNYADTVAQRQWREVDQPGALHEQMLVSDDADAYNRLRLFVSDAGHYDILVHVPHRDAPVEPVTYTLEMSESSHEYMLDPSGFSEGGWHLLDTREFQHGERFHMTISGPEGAPDDMREGSNMRESTHDPAGRVWFDALMLQRNHHWALE
ncbi:MAG: family 10 glycosylhydrolase [Cyclonatronaceae bacterium]